MSWPALNWAVLQRIKATKKLVLVMLAYRTDPDTDYATPSIEKLALDSGMSRSGIKAVLQQLQEEGLIEVEVRKVEGGRNLPNRYRLAFDRGQNLTPTGRGHQVTPEGPDSDPRRGHQVTTKAIGKANGCVSGGGITFDAWPEPPPEDLWQAWMRVRTAQRAPMTQEAADRIGKQMHAAARDGWTVEDCMGEIVDRSWRGFKADWMPKENAPGPGRTKDNHERGNYAQDHRERGAGRNRGEGAIDAVLRNAANRAEAARSAAAGARPDRGHDDGDAW